MPLTQEDHVCQAVRDGILAGGLPVGEFLSQRKLAERFDTSLITLRASLRRLENDGLIENVPRWGVRIPEDTPEKVQDRYFMRETLELAALARALPTMAEEQWRRLKELAEECDSNTGGAEAALRLFATAHHALHRCLVEYAGSPLLLEQYDRLMARNLMLINARRGWATGRDRGPRHHQALIQDLRDLSAAKAAAALRNHIRRGLTHELDVLGKETRK
jgi:DNA-binding GntR family transcriptional regulator